MSTGSTIDDKIVSIKFDNAAFEQNISDTMASLDKLSSKIATVGAGQGFSDISAAANSVDLSGLANGVDNISSKFSSMGAVAFSAIQSITQSVLGAASNFVSTDFLGPVITGGKQRAEELQQAEFQFQGLGINVQAVMANALAAVKGTSFGLGDAAKAAAQFGASGIQAGAEMQTSLSAIAGTAALTGDSFSDMAVLFTQSAAKGKVDNQDLMQFATRGFDAAAAFAKQTGTTEANVHAMASAGTLDYKTFAAAMDAAFGSHATDANQTYSGSLDNMHAAMSRLGASFLTPELDQQRDLFNAMGPAIDKVTAAIQPLFFVILGAKYQGGQGIIGFLNNLDFSNLDFGIQDFAEGLGNIIGFLKGIAIIGKDAFKDIFPGQFSITVDIIAAKFKELTEYLQGGLPTVLKIREIFDGLFSILDIGWGVIKGVATVIGDLLGALSPAGDGVFNFAAKTGVLLTNLDQFLIKGGAMQAFFVKIGGYITPVIGFISDFSQKVIAFFSTTFGTGLSDILGQVKGRLDTASSDATQVQSVWDKLMNSLQGVFTVLDTIWDGIKTWFHQLFQKIAAEMQPADFNSALDAVNVGLLGGITLMLKKFFDGGIKFGFGGGVFNNIKNTLKNVTQSLNLLQTNLKADALMKIAEAIAVLAAAILVLSLINSQDLTKALAAMVVGFGELAATMAILEKTTSTIGGAAKLDLVSGALIGLAAAMVLFSLAIKELSKLSLSELAKGLGGVAAGMAILVVGVNSLDEDNEGMIRAGISMGIIAIALRLLANAVKAFANMSWSEMAKGMVGIGVGLAAIVVAMNAMPSGGVLQGLGFIAIATGLRILADAVKQFGNMSWGEMAKGLVGITVALAGIAAAMNFMPADLPITALGVGILAVALGVMAEVLKKMGSIPFGELVKSLAALAVTLGILVVAMNAMDGGIVGALALVVVAGALEVLVDVLEKISKLSIGQLATGLGAIAATVLLLAGGSVALTEAIPSMLAMGAALTLIGLGFTLIGAGALLGVDALSKFATVGLAAIQKIGDAIPALAAAGADLLVNFANDLLVGVPTLLKTIKAVLDQLFETIIEDAPKLGAALEALITAGLLLIDKDFPLIVQTGFLVIQSFLTGISNNIGPITDAVTQIISNFSAAVVNDLPSIVTSAANMIVTFLTEIGNHEAEIISAGVNLVVQLILGLSAGQVEIVAAVVQLIVSFITEVGNGAVQIIAAGVQMLENLLTGIGSDLGSIVTTVGNVIIAFVTALENEYLTIITAGVNLIINFMNGISQQALKLADSAGQCILNFINGLTVAVQTYEPQIIAASINLGVAILTGVFQGITGSALGPITDWLGNLGKKVLNWVGDIAGDVASIGKNIVDGIWNGIVGRGDWFKNQIVQWVENHIPGWMRSILGILSPSKVMADIGQYIPMGLIVGIKSQTTAVKSTMTDLANVITGSFNPQTLTMNSVLTDFVNSLGDVGDFNPVITPVLDLSKIQEGAGSISDILGTTPISANVTSNNASNVAAAVTDAVSSANSKVEATAPGDVIFNQTINAPTELSTTDIYRNTKSQITLAKENLSIS